MAGSRYQPQGRATLSQNWRARLQGGFVASPSGYTSIGPASLSESSSFSAIKKVAACPVGLALSVDSLTDSGAAAALTIQKGIVNNDFTFGGVLRYRAVSGAGVFARSSSSTIPLYLPSSATLLRARVNGSDLTASISLAAGRFYRYVVTSNKSGIFMFVDGQLVASGAASTASDGGAQLYTFEDGVFAGGAWDADVALCFLMAGVQKEEAQSLSVNPWQIFADPYEDDEIFLAAAAAGPKAYTLAVNPGAFSLAGSSAALRLSRKLSAASGAFASDGAPVSLRAGRVLPAVSGAFALAGASISLRAARSIPASAGGFALTGAPAGLATARRLLGAAGEFSLAGADVRLASARRLSVGAGGFALSSGAAGLLAGRRVTAGGGSFALTGNGVSLRAARRLSAAPGVFGLAGAALVLTYQQAHGQNEAAQYALTAAPGSFGLSGSAVAMRVQRRLTAGQGGFALAGGSAALVYGRRLPAATGALALQGNAVMFGAARRLSAQAGEFDLTGAAAQLHYSAQIEYARAPAGSGYTPQRHEYQSRPAATSSSRPAAMQRNNR
jgi:hypothetical protein